MAEDLYADGGGAMSLLEFADKHPILVFLLVLIIIDGIRDSIQDWRK